MGLLDALFGRTKLKKAKPNAIFALSTAYLTLAEMRGWEPAGRAGVCLKPISGSEFDAAASELRRLVELAAKESETGVEVQRDEYGYVWIILSDPDFEDLVTLVHMAADELTAHGYGAQLLSAVFRFGEAAAPRYLIYNYKRGAFYPFVPAPGAEKRRQEPDELRFQAEMQKELPIEGELSRWYAMWDCPV